MSSFVIEAQQLEGLGRVRAGTRLRDCCSDNLGWDGPPFQSDGYARSSVTSRSVSQLCRCATSLHPRLYSHLEPASARYIVCPEEISMADDKYDKFVLKEKARLQAKEKELEKREAEFQ